MTKTAKLVRDLAETRGVLPYNDRASFLAIQFNRIEGIEGDETLNLIASLMRAQAITPDEAIDFTLAHARETASAATN